MNSERVIILRRNLEKVAHSVPAKGLVVAGIGLMVMFVAPDYFKCVGGVLMVGGTVSPIFGPRKGD